MAFIAFDGKSFATGIDVVESYGQLVDDVCCATGLTHQESIRIYCDGKPINHEYFNGDAPQSFASSVLRVHSGPGLVGGKGGFGANLKTAGRGPAKGTTFSLCRDLQGRRLGVVNNELRLKAWLSEEERAKREKLGETYEEPRGEDGIAGWYLGVPSWAEYKKDKSHGDPAMSRKKTDICKHWLEARKTGTPPVGAPRWWGCPRGNGCKFAHGEEELRREAKVAAAIARREETRAKQLEKLDDYTKGIFLYSTDGESSTSSKSMLTSVMQGLQAAAEKPPVAGKKRKREAMVTPHTRAWSDKDWILSVSDASEDATVEYHAADASSSGKDAVQHIAEVEGVADFATVAVSGVAVSADLDVTDTVSAFYEVELVTDGIIQLGWCDSQYNIDMSEGDGVGDHAHTWAYDGARGLKWNVQNYEYGRQWAAGDIVGCALRIKPAGDTQECEVEFFLNSESLGVAFEFTCEAGEIFFPAISLEQGEIARVNIGASGSFQTALKDEMKSVYSFRNAARLK